MLFSSLVENQRSCRQILIKLKNGYQFFLKNQTFVCSIFFKGQNICYLIFLKIENLVFLKHQTLDNGFHSPYVFIFQQKLVKWTFFSKKKAL